MTDVSRSDPRPPATAERPDAPEAGAEAAILRLDPIYFDYDRSDLRQDAREILSRHGAALVSQAGRRIVIEGHCDERGTVEYNLALGERRAHPVREFLIAYGVSPSRIQTISYGEERPAAGGHGESVWSRNRRAEFVPR